MALSPNNLKLVLDGLRDNQIDYLRFTWCDLTGISKCKIVPAQFFESLLKSGVTIAFRKFLVNANKI